LVQLRIADQLGQRQESGVARLSFSAAATTRTLVDSLGRLHCAYATAPYPLVLCAHPAS